MTEPPFPPREPGDPPDLDRVIRGLRDAWTEVPDADRSAIWQAIEGHLGPQDNPGRDPRPGFLRGAFGGVLHGWGGLFSGNPLRQIAIAGAAVIVVGALVLSGTFRSGTSASAEVLAQVNTLSLTTIAALDDDDLSAEEILQLRDEARRLLAQIDDDDQALRGLTAEQLAGVVDTLQRLILRLDDHEDIDDDDFHETVASIRTTSERAEGVRREHEDDDDDHDATATPLAALTAQPTAVRGTASATPTAAAAASTAQPTATSEVEHDPEDDDHPSATASATPVKTPSPSPTKTGTPGGTATPAPTSSPAPGTNSEQTIPAVPATYVRSVGAAGSVTFAYGSGQLTVVSVTKATGWQAIVEESAGSEIRVRFISGGTNALFEVERQDATLEITIFWSTGAS